MQNSDTVIEELSVTILTVIGMLDLKVSYRVWVNRFN